jgi:hypothetical protein
LQLIFSNCYTTVGASVNAARSCLLPFFPVYYQVVGVLVCLTQYHHLRSGLQQTLSGQDLLSALHLTAAAEGRYRPSRCKRGRVSLCDPAAQTLPQAMSPDMDHQQQHSTRYYYAFFFKISFPILQESTSLLGIICLRYSFSGIVTALAPLFRYM